MMKVFGYLLVCLLFSQWVWAKGDPKVGQMKVASCTACHGDKGVSPNDMWPNLAGQKEGYLSKQLNDFRSGSRKDPIMTAIVQTLDAEDIDHIAAYFSSL